jgi:glycosyltransferase involved in cell wall biosynthesis
MKIIQIPFCFYPDPPGGTEVYVESLSKQLQKQGIGVIIAAPANRSISYDHNGLKIRRFEISEKVNDLREFYGEGDLKAADEFAKILDEEKPDLVHMHALTYAVSLRLVQQIKLRGIKLVFTYHTPTVSCQRGTLMRWGKRPCDGKLRLRTCATCTLNGLGIPRYIACTIGLMPTFLSKAVGDANLSGGIWTALRMRELLHIRFAAFRAFMREMDHIIVLCNWCRELLLRNRIQTEKISIICHGIDSNFFNNSPNDEGLTKKDNPIKFIYIGRLDPVKGVDIVIRALRLIPEENLEFHIYGIAQNADALKYLKQLKRLAANDSRVIFMTVISNEQIIPTLRRYHFLVVPSRWLETGPLVILEAFAAGIPVLGSALGGISELVEDGVNGLLARHDSVKAWSKQIQKICKDKSCLKKLSSGIKPPRTMDVLTEEIATIYKELF